MSLTWLCRTTSEYIKTQERKQEQLAVFGEGGSVSADVNSRQECGVGHRDIEIQLFADTIAGE